MRSLRLAVLISGGGRTLLNLLDAIEAGSLSGQVVSVVSSRRQAAGVERARQRGLDVTVLRPRDFPDIEHFRQAQDSHLLGCAPDLVIMAGYLVHYPLPEALRGRALNIHPSLLPRHGGQGMYGDHVHAAVLAAGDAQSGCTVHVVDDEYDTGPVVLSQSVDVLSHDDVDSLAARVFEAECQLYPQAIRLYAEQLGLGEE